MIRRPCLALPLALAALVAFPAAALAQEKGGDKEGDAAEGAAAAPVLPKPKVEEPPPEVRGNRYRIKLKHGSQIEGILPSGVVWEKRDEFGEYVETSETEKGAGLRLFYVLNLEGETFILKRDVAEITDLGALTEKEKLEIQKKVLDQRKKALEDRERAFRAEMEKLARAEREEQKRAEVERKEKAKAGEKEGAKKEESSDDDARGDALLKKFPPPDWGPKRLEEILRREIVNGIFRSAEEREFIDGFKLWKAANERREKAEAEKGGGEGEKKETPPAGGGK